MPIYPANGVQAFTFANKPAAAAVAGQIIRVSDIGVGNGSLWFSNGTSLRPIAPIRLFNAASDYSGTYASETVVAQYQMPAGLLAVGDEIHILQANTKSGTNDTYTRRYRIGIAGTTSDALVATANSTTVYAAENQIFRLMSATTMRQVTVATQTSFGAVTSASSTTTIPDASANALYINYCLLHASGSETITTNSISIVLVPGAGL